MKDLLTLTDMVELTGAQQKKSQCEVLRNAGVRFITRADGWPILTKTALDNSLSPLAPEAQQLGDGFSLDHM